MKKHTYILHPYTNGRDEKIAYWRLYRRGADRASFTTKDWVDPADFDAVLSEAMTLADRMSTLVIKDTYGMVVDIFMERIVCLFSCGDFYERNN
jgi:hypothetical protein